jgi:hypothetical protein
MSKKNILPRQNIFKKQLAIIKRVCIFAPSFSGADLLNTITKILKIQSNEQKNVSTIEKKKKK